VLFVVAAGVYGCPVAGVWFCMCVKLLFDVAGLVLQANTLGVRCESQPLKWAHRHFLSVHGCCVSLLAGTSGPVSTCVPTVV
jgi:hypothetical protein